MNTTDFSNIDNVEPETEDSISPSAVEILTPDEKRNNREKNHVHWAKLLFIWGLAMSALAILIVIVLHLLLPTSWRWLSTEDIAYLKGLFVSGIGGAILTKFGNKLTE
jgi:hypothetical protein